MNRSALIYLAAVLAPCGLLAWLGWRAAGHEAAETESRRIAFYQKSADAAAAAAEAGMELTARDFRDAVETLGRSANPADAGRMEAFLKGRLPAAEAVFMIDPQAGQLQWAGAAAEAAGAISRESDFLSGKTTADCALTSWEDQAEIALEKKITVAEDFGAGELRQPESLTAKAEKEGMTKPGQAFDTMLKQNSSDDPEAVRFGDGTVDLQAQFSGELPVAPSAVPTPVPFAAPDAATPSDPETASAADEVRKQETHPPPQIPAAFAIEDARPAPDAPAGGREERGREIAGAGKILPGGEMQEHTRNTVSRDKAAAPAPAPAEKAPPAPAPAAAPAPPAPAGAAPGAVAASSTPGKPPGSPAPAPADMVELPRVAMRSAPLHDAVENKLGEQTVEQAQPPEAKQKSDSDTSAGRKEVAVAKAKADDEIRTKDEKTLAGKAASEPQSPAPEELGAEPRKAKTQGPPVRRNRGAPGTSGTATPAAEEDSATSSRSTGRGFGGGAGLSPEQRREPARPGRHAAQDKDAAKKSALSMEDAPDASYGGVSGRSDDPSSGSAPAPDHESSDAGVDRLIPATGPSPVRALRVTAPLYAAPDPDQPAASRVVLTNSDFPSLTSHASGGIASRLADGALSVILWHRPSWAPASIIGVVMSEEKLRTLIAARAGLSAPDADAVLCFVDHRGAAFGGSRAPGRALVAREIGPSLPLWEAAVFLTNADALGSAGSAARWRLSLSVLAVLSAGIAGAVLLLRDTRRTAREARQKVDFVSSVSHELKTPLTSIRMFSDLLASDAEPPPEKRRRYAETIAAESARLSRLISNVLDFARLERREQRLNREPVDLRDLLVQFEENQGASLERDGFALSSVLPADPVKVSADRDALSQILLNLLANALKYGHRPGGAREITLTLSAGPRDAVVITVADRGPGVPPGHEARIFRQFHRANDGMNSTASGTGLGLAIARGLAEAHGGTLTYQRREGGGALFRLSLPA